MNNEISFDSNKFSISKLEKMRPQETIDNLNDFGHDDSEETHLDQKNFPNSNVRFYLNENIYFGKRYQFCRYQI